MSHDKNKILDAVCKAVDSIIVTELKTENLSIGECRCIAYEAFKQLESYFKGYQQYLIEEYPEDVGRYCNSQNFKTDIEEIVKNE